LEQLTRVRVGDPWDLDVEQETVGTQCGLGLPGYYLEEIFLRVVPSNTTQ